MISQCDRGGGDGLPLEIEKETGERGGGGDDSGYPGALLAIVAARNAKKGGRMLLLLGTWDDGTAAQLGGARTPNRGDSDMSTGRFELLGLQWRKGGGREVWARCLPGTQRKRRWSSGLRWRDGGDVLN